MVRLALREDDRAGVVEPQIPDGRNRPQRMPRVAQLSLAVDLDHQPLALAPRSPRADGDAPVSTEEDPDADERIAREVVGVGDVRDERANVVGGQIAREMLRCGFFGSREGKGERGRCEKHCRSYSTSSTSSSSPGENEMSTERDARAIFE